MNKIVIILVIGLLLFSSCKKDEPELQTKHKMTYVLETYDKYLDEKIGAAVLYTGTYFPHEGITELRSRLKSRSNLSYEDFLHDYDTININTKRSVYTGCVIHWEVQLRFFTDPFHPDYTTYIKTMFFSRTDTIKSISNDTIVKFSFPNDTAYIKPDTIFYSFYNKK
jgi:hypothetical protein